MATQKSIFEELKPFAGMVIDQGRGVTVSDLAFSSAEDFYSTGIIALSTLTLPAGSPVSLFKANVGDNGGQGWTSGTLTIAETNNKNGDRQPSNQVYIATHLGFQIYALTGVVGFQGIYINNPHSLYLIAINTTWSLTVGDGIKRTLGTIMEYPAGSGIDADVAIAGSTDSLWSCANNGWVGCQKRKLPIPIVFPPNIQVDIELKTGAAQILHDNVGDTGSVTELFTGGAIAYKATFTGFRMTMPA
jgi:hypothetical protein